MNVGMRIAEARRKKGMSMRQLGAAVGVSHVFVRQVETGASPLPRGRALAFAATLGLSIADLTELDPATLAVVEARLLATGRCARAVRIVREMAGGGVAPKRPCSLCGGAGRCLAVDAIEADGRLANPRPASCLICGDGAS